MSNKEYFIENNKSGYRSKEKWLLKNNKSLYDNIVKNSENIPEILFKERIWLYINGKTEIPQCECGNKLKFKKSLRDGYGEYCSIKCTNKSNKHKDKVKQTNIKKYGGVSPSHSDVVKDKIKQTNISEAHY